MEPYSIVIQGTLPDGHDINDDADSVMSQIADGFEKSGHAVDSISITHGALRGGSKSWVPPAAPTDAAVTGEASSA